MMSAHEAKTRALPMPYKDSDPRQQKSRKCVFWQFLNRHQKKLFYSGQNIMSLRKRNIQIPPPLSPYTYHHFYQESFAYNTYFFFYFQDFKFLTTFFGSPFCGLGLILISELQSPLFVVSSWPRNISLTFKMHFINDMRGKLLLVSQNQKQKG